MIEETINIPFTQIEQELWRYTTHNWDTKTWTGWFKRYDFINSENNHQILKELISAITNIDEENIAIFDQNIVITTAPATIRGFYEWQHHAVRNGTRDDLSSVEVEVHYFLIDSDNEAVDYSDVTGNVSDNQDSIDL